MATCGQINHEISTQLYIAIVFCANGYLQMVKAETTRTERPKNEHKNTNIHCSCNKCAYVCDNSSSNALQHSIPKMLQEAPFYKYCLNMHNLCYQKKTEAKQTTAEPRLNDSTCKVTLRARRYNELVANYICFTAKVICACTVEETNLAR